MQVLYTGRIGIWSKDENQQQTQPTYDREPELNPGHIGGRRALSPLRHPCSSEILLVCREGYEIYMDI